MNWLTKQIGKGRNEKENDEIDYNYRRNGLVKRNGRGKGNINLSKY